MKTANSVTFHLTMKVELDGDGSFARLAPGSVFRGAMVPAHDDLDSPFKFRVREKRVKNSGKERILAQSVNFAACKDS